MKRKAGIVLGLLLALSLALAGCGDRITAEEIVAHVQETVESTQDAHALVAANLNAQGMEMTVTVEVWEKSPNKLRAEVVEASQPDLVGSLLVSDGRQGMAYNPARNQATVGPVEQIETPLPQQLLTKLQEVIQEVMEASNTELLGEEVVAGHDTYKLALSPKEGAEQEFFPGGGTATLWVDQERWIVLKATYEGSSFGQGSMEVRSFEQNPGLADDLFRPEVPEGATIIDAAALSPEPLTLDEAKAQAGFPLLLPDYVPEGATLIEVYRIADAIYLHYDTSPQASFTLMQGPEAGFTHLEGSTAPGAVHEEGSAQQIVVRGRDATLVTDVSGDYTFLSWNENGVTVVVGGRISSDEAIKVAESLK